MIRGAIPRLFDTPMEFNRARVLAEGGDVLVLSSGVCTEGATTAVAALRVQGVDVGHLHVSTLKPFDDPTVIEHLRRVRRGVLTVENHTVVGGLGSAVAEVMAQHGVGVPLRRLGLQDTYAHGASKDYLMRQYQIDGPAVLAAVAEMVGARLDGDVTELGAPRLVGADGHPLTQDE